jgi:hypothetical protein
MFWSFKLSFVVDILAFFALETFGATFLKYWAIFFKSSGHPVAKKVRQNEPDNLTLRGCSDDGDLIFKPLHLPGLQTEQCDFFQEDNKREN